MQSICDKKWIKCEKLVTITNLLLSRCTEIPINHFGSKSSPSVLNVKQMFRNSSTNFCVTANLATSLLYKETPAQWWPGESNPLLQKNSSNLKTLREWLQSVQSRPQQGKRLEIGWLPPCVLESKIVAQSVQPLGNQLLTATSYYV